MQSTSANYQSIVAAADHIFEPKLVIDGVTYTKTSLISISTSIETMSGAPSVGRGVSTEINIELLNPTATVPPMATMELYVRAKSASLNLTSEWIPQGVYFVDTRKTTSNDDGLDILTIHGFDAIMKTEADYPDTEHDWPYKDKSVVAEIAAAIGVSVDSRTNSFLTSGYMLDLPAGYTMRETLGQIAAAYGGNFVMTAENKLLFVPLYGLEIEESGSYLADENGNALVFGNEGWFILV